MSLKSMETHENGLQTHSGASLQSCTTTLHFIWSDIADSSLMLGVNGPLRSNSTNLCMNPELVEEVELDMNHKSCDWSEQCHRYVEHLRKEQFST